ncbi:glutathione transferase [Tripterygium wilfordii]|uniref:glutathione transferase n=1 Tax=Tripterygium wilfordii TaxID=458696 RepID=A0A7J7CMP8_TRIWF|nr:probable glutathione S-transferase [Tripterygium wilfordii]KAF5735278.1 glutathione transferase [Tripterygium wilfordii]
MAEEVKLFKTWSSIFGLRIVWALKLKGIKYDYADEDISNKSSLLLNYNPIYKKVPVLVHNGNPVVESLVILEYIEETWKQNPLLPQDPLQRAMARFWASFGVDKILPSMWDAFIKEGKEQEEAFTATTDNFNYLEEQLKGKKFFNGDTIGYSDITLGWLANLTCIFEEITHTTLIDRERFPLLFGWIHDFSNAPIIKETLPPHDKLIDKYIALRKAFHEAQTQNA